MKWLKRIGLALVALLLIVAAAGFWLLESESGARFALERVKRALADKLSFEQAHGTLASPLELTNLRYRDPAAGLDVSIQRVKVDYALYGLLHKTLRVRALEADGVTLALSTVPPAPNAAPAPALEILLTPPLAVRLEQAHVGALAVSQDGNPVFASDSLDAALDWTAQALDLTRFALRTPDGTLDLSARLDSYRDLRGNGHAAFDWRAGTQRVAGSADFGSDGRNARAQVALTKPTAATLDASVAPGADALPWTLHATVPRFDPRRLAPDASLNALALDLSGSGDRTHARVSGALDLDAHRVLLEPLDVALGADKTLTVNALTLRSPEAAGTLHAQGRVALGADPASAELTLDWDGVEIPADLAGGQALATHGHLAAGGSAKAYSANGEFVLGPRAKPANFSVALNGTPQTLTLERLALKQPAGGLDARGTVTLSPRVGWDLNLAAHRFDPGAFAAQWPGAIDAALHTQGRMEKDGPAGTLALTQLGGTLRRRALGGSADLTFAAPARVDGTLTLKSGNSSVTLRGQGGSATDVTLELALASLGDWLPDAGGALRGSVALRGTWPKLDAKGKFEATKLVYGGVHADTLTGALDVHDLNAPDGTLTLGGKSLAAAGYTFDTFALDAHGNERAHHAGLDLQGPQLGLELALDGALERTPQPAWSGRLATFALTPKGAAPWALEHPAALRVAGVDVTLDELCLAAGNARVCAAATQQAGATQTHFTLAHLPLTLIARIASPDAPLTLAGELDGSGELRREVDGALAGHADIGSASGAVGYPDSAAQPLLSYRNFKLQAALGAQQNVIDVHSEFSDGGHLAGHVTLGTGGANGMPLSGTLEANLGNLGFVDLLSSQTSDTKGTLNAKLLLSGSTAAPALGGNVALAGFATEVPSAGLKLHDGNITLQSADGRSFTVAGSVASGDGKLALGGNVSLAPDGPFGVTLNGENWLAADIPGAQVRISPNLTITRESGTYVVGGSVGIPKADIDVSKLQASNPAAARSPDVVVSDAERSNAAAAASAPIRADITVKLGAGEKLAMDLRQGQEVHLVGFGLNGYLSGQLAVQESPGRATTGRGQIVVDGTYKAYGQDLKIEQGRLLFAGTPIDNPGLDLRATRSGFADPDVTVGLQVRGTAQVPVLTVFSEPAMEQSDALSYLVAGKPLSQLKSGEGDAVGSAARALGTAGGDLLAKSIGTRMGLDDVGVADSSAVGGAALTVGKYLSPRLYLSYGVGLFTPGEVVTLRYRLTRLFNVEIQNGTLSSRAGINYKVEK